MHDEKKCRERNDGMRRDGDKDIVKLYGKLIEELGVDEDVLMQIQEAD